MKRRLPLNNLTNSRKTLSRLIRLFDQDEIPEGKYRALIYGFSCLLAFFKAETEQEVISRIEALEIRVSEIDMRKVNDTARDENTEN